MYSPRIPETYIPLLYRLARRRGAPMTALVAEAVAAYLEREAPAGVEVEPASARPDPAGAAPADGAPAAAGPPPGGRGARLRRRRRRAGRSSASTGRRPTADG
jgi:hypothetical protein